jgi:hypothetical protein
MFYFAPAPKAVKRFIKKRGSVTLFNFVIIKQINTTYSIRLIS